MVRKYCFYVFVMTLIHICAQPEMAQAYSTARGIRVSAVFNTLHDSVNSKVTFTLPNDTTVARIIEPGKRLSISDDFEGVTPSSQFQYALSSEYATIDDHGAPRPFEDKGACKGTISLEKEGKKLVAIQLVFTLNWDRNPRTEDGPWYSCVINGKYAP